MVPKASSVLLGLLLAGGVAVGQAARPEPPPDLMTELATLNKTMREIADLLAQEVGARKVDLLMKRVELASAAIARSEDRVRFLRSERDAVETEKRKLESERDMIRSHRESGGLDGSRQEDVDAYLSRMDADLKRLSSKLQAASADLADAENHLTEERETYRQLQRELDRRIAGP